VRRAFKFRAYPTRPQEARAVRLLADHCDLYNAALEERREAWRIRRVSVSYGMQSAQLKEIRRADPQGQGRHSFTGLQRRKERARRGSGNRTRIRRQLAKEWRKVRNRRRDFHHKTARALVDSCDVIALEKLSTANMIRRPAPKPYPGQPGAFLPNMASAKAGLNKAILDAGWAQFASILTAKAESAGR
jgi:transposase